MIIERQKGDFVVDIRVNVVGDEGREKMAYIGDQKLGFRAKIPRDKAQEVFNALKYRFNKIVNQTNEEVKE